MKFWAKVNLEGIEREWAAFLLMRFFEEFNPESSICFKGQEAIMEVVFDEPPNGIIKALSYFTDGKLEFYYGKNPEEYENGPSFESGKVRKETETSEQSTQEAAEQPTNEVTKNSEENALVNPESTEEGETQSTIEPIEESQVEDSDEQPNNVSKESHKARHPRGLGKTDKPDLSEFAQKATSYEAFCESIADWINMKGKHTSFIQLILAAGEVKEIAWKNIDAILAARGIQYKSYDRIWIGQRINEKFRETGKHVTTLPLLYEIVSYANYDFLKQSGETLAEVNAEEVSDETIPKEIPEEVEVISEETPVMENSNSEDVEELQTSIAKTRVRMKCMLGENMHLEEVLGNVDKTQPIEERVKCVLRAMGWIDDENNIEHQQIFRMANIGVRTRKISFEMIYSKADIPEEEQADARMRFSKFINDALIKGPYFGFKVHVSEFLRELQSIIMLESEFEDSNV